MFSFGAKNNLTLRTVRAFSIAVLGCGLLVNSGLLAGCGVNAKPGSNLPPLSRAGVNQTATGGDLVTLDGSGSGDPEGQAISFTWVQQEGTPVVLTAADTAFPSFTAPDVDETLTFKLIVSDGAQADADEMDVVVTAATPQPSPTPAPQPAPTPAPNPSPSPKARQLFIANRGGDNITSYASPETINGNITPDGNVAGLQTKLVTPFDVVVNSADELIALNHNSAAVTLYAGASAANGNLSPDANVEGLATGMVAPVSMTINKGEDLLFVGESVGPEILVYSGTTAATFNGNLAPLRRIKSTGNLTFPSGINFGASDDLYVANLTNVLVFANASSLNGDVAPTRIISSPVFAGGAWDVFIDDDDTMYVCENTRVHMFANASTLNGTVQPDATLEVAGATFLSSIVVDSDNTAYLADFGTDGVHSFDAISSLNGTFAPNRLIKGANTQLHAPWRLHLVE